MILFFNIMLLFFMIKQLLYTFKIRLDLLNIGGQEK